MIIKSTFHFLIYFIIDVISELRNYLNLTKNKYLNKIEFV